jgi:hypothetical protein
MDVSAANTRMVVMMFKILCLSMLFSMAAMADATSLEEGMKESKLLRSKGLYRADINFNIGLISKNLKAEHKKLIALVKENESVDDVNPHLQKIYLTIYADYYKLISNATELSDQLKSDHNGFTRFYQLLEGLEIKVGAVNKINDKANAHIKSLEGSIYKSSFSFYVQYLSWQEKTDIENITNNTEHKLIITNKATCLGGDFGIENEKFHYYLDACAMIGSGTVTGQNESIYSQSSLPLFGAKVAPGFSYIPTSSNSRIGFKIPVMYSTQKISDFEADGSSYEVTKKDHFFIAGALYSRWYLKRFYVSAELGKFVTQQEAYWAFGAGFSL